VLRLKEAFSAQPEQAILDEEKVRQVLLHLYHVGVSDTFSAQRKFGEIAAYKPLFTQVQPAGDHSKALAISIIKGATFPEKDSFEILMK